MKIIIHAVGPVWRGGEAGEPELLAACYRRAIELAAEHECGRVAFPAISTGAFGYPLADAARIALTETWSVMAAHPIVIESRFWLFDQFVFDTFGGQLDLMGIA